MKLATFEAICTALNDASVRFLVAGGLAVNAHGYLRLNVDDIAHLRTVAEEKNRGPQDR